MAPNEAIIKGKLVIPDGLAQSSGFQHKRVSTGSIGIGLSQAVTVLGTRLLPMPITQSFVRWKTAERT